MPGTKAIILGTASCSSEDLESALEILSEDELQRFRAFHFDQDRKDYALAHALLRKTLSDLEPGTAQCLGPDYNCGGNPNRSLF